MKGVKTPAVIGVIPARWGSTRFPGKMLAPLCGKPLVQWVWEAARKARRLDAVLVATEDDRVCEAVRRFGGEAVLTRADHPSGTDRVAEAVAGRGAEVVINIQGDEPLLDPAVIDRLAGGLADDASWDMATAAAPLAPGEDLRSPMIVKVVFAADGRALYFSRAVIPHVRDDGSGARAAGSLYWRHIGIYAYRRGFLEKLVAAPPCALELAEKLEQLRVLHLGGRMKVIPVRHAGLAVDVPGDVPRVEAAIRARGERPAGI
jgi:3-deoxy-manno-octulosonate cytidylyltransferase (CMP-KDO synthetase)